MSHAYGTVVARCPFKTDKQIVSCSNKKPNTKTKSFKLFEEIVLKTRYTIQCRSTTCWPEAERRFKELQNKIILCEDKKAGLEGQKKVFNWLFLFLVYFPSPQELQQMSARPAAKKNSWKPQYERLGKYQYRYPVPKKVPYRCRLGTEMSWWTLEILYP